MLWVGSFRRSSWGQLAGYQPCVVGTREGADVDRWAFEKNEAEAL